LALTLKKPSDLRASGFMSKSKSSMKKYKKAQEYVRGYEKELIERVRSLPPDSQREAILRDWDGSEVGPFNRRLSPKRWFQVLQHVPLQKAVETKAASGQPGMMVKLESLVRLAKPEDGCGEWLAFYRRTGKLNTFQARAVKALIKELESRERKA
jgi:hypothetical protein